MRILLAFDTSDESGRAREWAGRLASGEARSTITVVGVVPTLEMTPATRDAVDPTSHPERLQAALDDAAAELAKQVPNARVRTTLLAGNPAEQLVEAARSADVIVIGKAGAHGMRRFLIGGVTERVARHAKSPVFIIP
ncbi:MAG: universal stress protein [Candidatus Dormiibacterota bacterium]